MKSVLSEYEVPWDIYPEMFNILLDTHTHTHTHGSGVQEKVLSQNYNFVSMVDSHLNYGCE